jgi:TrkA-N domain
VLNFWIIGGGKFGLKAAQELGKAKASVQITIVEKARKVCRQISMPGYRTVCMDGIQYLDRHLISAHDPGWIVPAIPLHVAYEWIRAKLTVRNAVLRIPVPAELAGELPHPIRGATGRLYMSIADFKCPDHCPEPSKICVHTGKPRSMILYEFLKSIQHNHFKSIVIRSHQLAPGVGGYKPAELFKALKEIESTQAPVLLSTACKCHGVMDAFKLSSGF